MSRPLSSQPPSPVVEPTEATMAIAVHNQMLEEESALLRELIGVGDEARKGGEASGGGKEDEGREDEGMRESEGIQDEGIRKRGSREDEGMPDAGALD
jgi:hypothetical protein